MTMTVFQISSVDFNSYITLQEAVAKLRLKLTIWPTWSVTEDEQKKVLLARAVELLDNLNWKGEKADKAQPNAFPRVDVPDIPDGEIPAEVETAQALLAGTLAVDPTLAEHDRHKYNGNFKRKKADTNELEWFEPFNQEELIVCRSVSQISPEAYGLIAKYLDIISVDTSGAVAGYDPNSFWTKENKFDVI